MMFKNLCILIFIALITACSTKKEIVLRVPIVNVHDSFDYIQRSDSYTRMINRNIFQSLINYSNNIVTADIAYQWRPIDTDEYDVFQLKFYDDVRFSDGTLVSSEDIIQSLYRALRHPATGHKSQLRIDSISVEHDVMHIYSSSNYLLVSFLSFAPIMKAEQIALGDDFIKHNAIGSGFYYVDSKNDSLVVLKKNRFHRNIQEIINSPDRVELIIEPSLSKQSDMLRAKEVDILLNAPYQDYQDIISNAGYEIINIYSNRVFYLMLDTMREEPPGLKIYSKDPKINKNPFMDKRVRFAIAHSLNLDDLIEKQFYNMAYPLAIPIPRHFFGYPADKEHYAFDLDLSRQLMAESGYSEGFEMTLRTTDNEIHQIIATFIRDSLKEINIDVNIELYPTAQLSDVIDATETATYITGYVAVSSSFVGSISTIYNYGHPNLGLRNVYRNRIPGLHTLIADLSFYPEGDITNPDLINNIIDLIYDNAVVIPLLNPNDTIIYSTDFTFDYHHDFLFKDLKYVKKKN